MNKFFAYSNHDRSFVGRAFAAFAAVLIVVAVALSLCFHPGMAWAGNDGTDTNMRVNDFNGVLSEDDESFLSKKIKKLEPQLKFDVVVYISSNAGTRGNAKGFFEKNDFGYGDASDGIVLGYNPDTQECAVYANGIGTTIFSDADIKALEDAFVETAPSKPAQATYDFLANASIKAGAYQGVSVSSEWPNRTKASSGSAATTPAPANAAANTAANTSANTKPSAHTTAELDWYPKDPSSFVEFHNPDAPRVVDNADLLTDDEEAALVAKIKDMEDRLDMDFVLYTDISSYGLSRGLYAADFYTFNGYGRGDDYTGVIYFVCMEPGNRGFWTAACGSAQELMTEDNVNKMDDATFDYFKSGDYAKAINIQFDNLDVLYTNKGFPIDWSPVLGAIIIAFIISLVLASKEVRQLKKKMITVMPARYAREYASGPVFSVKTDTHTDTKVTRTKHYTPSDSDSGSSGRSSYSGGYSSSGGSSHTFSGGGRSF